MPEKRTKFIQLFLIALLVQLHSYCFLLKANEKLDSITINEYNLRARELVRKNPDSSVLLSRKVLRNLELQKKKERATALNNIGISKQYLGELDSSLFYNEIAGTLFLEVNDSVMYASVLINIGNAFLERSNYPEVQNYYEKAYRIFNRFQDVKGQAKAINNLGNVFYYQGNYKKALEYYFKVLQIEHERGNLRGQAICNLNIGIMYHKMNKNREALRYYTNSLSIYDELDQNHSKVKVENQIGISYHAMGKTDSALFHYRNAHDISNKSNYRLLLPVIENNIGEAMLSAGMYAKALLNFEKAYALNKLVNDKNSMSFNLIGQGKVLNRVKSFRKAEKKLLTAYSFGEELSSPEIVKYAAQELSISYEGQRKVDKALSYYKTFKEMEDSLLNMSNIERLTALRMQYDFDIEQKNKELIQVQKDARHREEIRELRYRQFRVVAISLASAFLLIMTFLLFAFIQKNRINKLKIEINRNVQRLLGQQMNPHFIFNTLKSIQNYILKNETKESNKYLTRFSKLIRKILENSQAEFISLKDEMEALELYMSLENLRLNDKFEFDFVIDNKIDTVDIKVPSLLFQPFIENAIWHGISMKEGRGHIKIELQLAQEQLCCSVADNGIGRNRAGINKGKNHKSLGTSITNKRIELINSLYKTSIRPKFIDLYDSKGSASGTIVEFMLPRIH